MLKLFYPYLCQDLHNELPLPKPVDLNSRFGTKLDKSLFEERALSPKPLDSKKNGIIAPAKDEENKNKSPLPGSEATSNSPGQICEEHVDDDYFDDECSNSSRLVVAEGEEAEESQGECDVENGSSKYNAVSRVENGRGNTSILGLDMSKRAEERQHNLHEEEETDDNSVDMRHEM